MSLDLKRVYSVKFPEGKFTWEELDETYNKMAVEKLTYLKELLRSGREEDAAELINYHIGNGNYFPHELNSQTALLIAHGYFTNKRLLYDLILSVYTNDGYGFPQKLIMLAKQLAKDIPDEERLKDLPAGDPVIVYRGSYTPPKEKGKTRKEFSWTTDLNTAIFFAYKDNRNAKDPGIDKPPAYLYQAEIQRSKIIAYMTDRDESEILQFDNVKNVTLYPAPTEEEVQALFDARAEEYKQHIANLTANQT